MLQKIGFLPGFNKQITETTAEGQWVDGDNVRFRYGTPEKIGGWAQLGENKLTGAARALHHLVNNIGTQIVALDPETPFIPFEDLTNEIIVGWTKDAMGEEQVQAIEDGIASQIAELENPTSVTLTIED